MLCDWYIVVLLLREKLTGVVFDFSCIILKMLPSQAYVLSSACQHSVLLPPLPSLMSCLKVMPELKFSMRAAVWSDAHLRCDQTEWLFPCIDAIPEISAVLNNYLRALSLCVF